MDVEHQFCSQYLRVLRSTPARLVFGQSTWIGPSRLEARSSDKHRPTHGMQLPIRHLVLSLCQTYRPTLGRLGGRRSRACVECTALSVLVRDFEKSVSANCSTTACGRHAIDGSQRDAKALNGRIWRLQTECHFHATFAAIELRRGQRLDEHLHHRQERCQHGRRGRLVADSGLWTLSFASPSISTTSSNRIAAPSNDGYAHDGAIDSIAKGAGWA